MQEQKTQLRSAEGSSREQSRKKQARFVHAGFMQGHSLGKNGVVR